MNGPQETLAQSLAGTTVIEAGDERGEFAGLLLASLGAEIIKLEGRGGSNSRRIGPFASPAPDPEQSLCFWRYNLNKKSVALDADHPAAEPVIERLATRADVVIDSGEAGAIERRMPLYQRLMRLNPRLVVCTITPFGLDGPYRDLAMTDLTQLAMGGVMAVCGYDPQPDGAYDTAPIAPAMWHSYHLAGEYAAVSITAALHFRDLCGEGQTIDVSIHEAVNTCTEGAMPYWIYQNTVIKRQTARHATPVITPPWLHRSSDGGYVNSTAAGFDRDFEAVIRLLDDRGIDHDLHSEAYKDQTARTKAMGHIDELLVQLVGSMTAEEGFHRAQAKGIGWACVRRPEENLDDPHFKARGTFAPIHHPELGRDLYYPASVATGGKQRIMGPSRRAPRLGEHTREVLTAAGLDTAQIDALAAAGAI